MENRCIFVPVKGNQLKTKTIIMNFEFEYCSPTGQLVMDVTVVCELMYACETEYAPEAYSVKKFDYTLKCEGMDMTTWFNMNASEKLMQHLMNAIDAEVQNQIENI